MSPDGGAGTPAWVDEVLELPPEVDRAGVIPCPGARHHEPLGGLAPALERAGDEGWVAAARTLAEDDPGLLSRIADVRRADFAVLLSLEAGARVWDCAADLGAVSVGLARLGCRVVSSDVSALRTAFTRLRAEQEGLGHRLAALHAGRVQDVPVRPGSLDAVILRGRPLRIDDLRPPAPADAEVQLLGFLAGRLRPGGRLWVTAARRRDPEDPGPEAWVASRRTMERTLRRAGFAEVRAWIPLPRSDAFYVLAPRDRGHALARAARERAGGGIRGRALAWAGRLPGFWRLLRRRAPDLAYLAVR